MYTHREIETDSDRDREREFSVIVYMYYVHGIITELIINLIGNFNRYINLF
jgi:uncharacterized membrane protein